MLKEAKLQCQENFLFDLDPANTFVSLEHHLQSYPLGHRSARGDMQELLSSDKSHLLLSKILLQPAIYKGKG
jgi:hypothetical protein